MGRKKNKSTRQAAPNEIIKLLCSVVEKGTPKYPYFERAFIFDNHILFFIHYYSLLNIMSGTNEPKITCLFPGMSSSLQWIEESLTEAADDLETETEPDDEAIPILPFAEADLQAMEDELFQQTLLAIGIMKPADEQVFI